MPHRPGYRGPMDRLVDSTQFERALRSRSKAATVHFAVHHSAGHVRRSTSAELSTTLSTTGARPVDELVETIPDAASLWLGAVVPKRHARRAVTRTLLKRQIYGVAERHRSAMADGIWVVRLRAPFDRTQFTSAASEALKASARGELEALFGHATATSRPHTGVTAA